MQAYYDKVVQGDGAGACQLLTEDAQRTIVRGAAAIAPDVKSCDEAVKKAAASITEEGRERVAHLQERMSVQVSGEHATVRVKGTDKATLELTKIGGSWRISAGLG
jgi:ketosteroid isomerase-like protein